MDIGYVRVSTYEQNFNLQKDALYNAGCEKILEDKIHGAADERKGLKLAMELLREGDVLVVWRLDRLGRSLKNLIEIMADLENKKIGFKSLHEAIDTTTSSGKLVFHIFAALAEFEKNLIHERAMAGLKAARARGLKGGRPKALNNTQQKTLVKLYDERKHTIKEICEIMKITKPTLYRYLKKSKINKSDK